jgi:hypothetical protein
MGATRETRHPFFLSCLVSGGVKNTCGGPNGGNSLWFEDEGLTKPRHQKNRSTRCLRSKEYFAIGPSLPDYLE